MQFILSIVALAASVGFANAQVSASDLPACAQACVAAAVTKEGCAANDVACSCAAQTAITTDATPCVLSSCSPADIATTLQVSGEICVDFSSTVGAAPATTSVAATTSVPVATTTSEVSSTLESSAAPTTTEASSTVVETSSVVVPTESTPVAPLSTTTVASTTVAATTVVSSVSGAATGTGSGSGSSPSTTGIPPFTGAASANKAAATMGSVFAMALAAAAML